MVLISSCLVVFQSFAQNPGTQVKLTPRFMNIGSVDRHTTTQGTIYLINDREANILVKQCLGQQDIVMRRCPGGIIKPHEQSLIDFVFVPSQTGKIDKVITIKYQEYIPHETRPDTPLSRQDRSPPKLSKKIYELDFKITGQAVGGQATPTPPPTRPPKQGQ